MSASQSEAQEVAVFIQQAGEPVVTDQGTYNHVLGIAKATRAKARDLEDRRMAITRPIDESKAAIIKLFAVPIDRLKTFERQAKRALQGYLDEQQAKLREEQCRRDEAAAREKARMEAEVTRQREKEAEERRKAETARKAAQATKDKAEREKREAEASAAEERAKAAKARADAKQHIAETVKPAQVKSQAEAHGISKTVNYDPVVEDKRLFVEWVLRTDRLEYLDVNIPLIKRDCQAAKGVRTFEGIRIVQGHTTRMR